MCPQTFESQLKPPIIVGPQDVLSQIRGDNTSLNLGQICRLKIIIIYERLTIDLWNTWPEYYGCTQGDEIYNYFYATHFIEFWEIFLHKSKRNRLKIFIPRKNANTKINK